MNTSGGGGFCDCGDIEAWKDGVACDTHQHTGDTDMEEVLIMPKSNLVPTTCLSCGQHQKRDSKHDSAIHRPLVAVGRLRVFSAQKN